MRNVNLRLWFVFVLTLAALYVVFTKPLNLGLDLQGGSRLVLQCQSTEKLKVTDDAVQGVVAVIRNRIDALGVAEPIIQRKGSDQVIVELPGIKDPNRAIHLIGDTAVLEFMEAEWVTTRVEALTPNTLAELYGEGARLATTREQNREGKNIPGTPIILKKLVLTGANLKTANVDFDQFGQPVVAFEFDGEGARLFGEATARSVGKPIAILLDKKVISAPRVNEPILGGRGQISGNFTIDEVKDLVIKLKAGALPVPVEIVENKNIGATLGKDSLEKSQFAGIIGCMGVFIFMIFYYRLPGFLANLALLLYVFLVISILSLLNVTLTLPGIAGFLLSIGMAVDANVIIFERLKEELRDTHVLKTAIDHSFKRAFNAILDSNVTTLIGTAVLFQLGTGTIKGFAVALSIGILTSMFTALTVTKVFLDKLVASTRIEANRLLFLK